MMSKPTPTTLRELLANHHHLPTAKDIGDVWNKNQTDVMDTATTVKAILEQLKALLPEKVDQFPNKYNEDEMTGWNHAIDQIEKAIEEWAK